MSSYDFTADNIRVYDISHRDDRDPVDDVLRGFPGITMSPDQFEPYGYDMLSGNSQGFVVVHDEASALDIDGILGVFLDVGELPADRSKNDINIAVQSTVNLIKTFQVTTQGIVVMVPVTVTEAEIVLLAKYAKRINLDLKFISSVDALEQHPIVREKCLEILKHAQYLGIELVGNPQVQGPIGDEIRDALPGYAAITWFWFTNHLTSKFMIKNIVRKSGDLHFVHLEALADITEDELMSYVLEFDEVRTARLHEVGRAVKRGEIIRIASAATLYRNAMGSRADYASFSDVKTFHTVKLLHEGNAVDLATNLTAQVYNRRPHVMYTSGFFDPTEWALVPLFAGASDLYVAPSKAPTRYEPVVVKPNDGIISYLDVEGAMSAWLDGVLIWVEDSGFYDNFLHPLSHVSPSEFSARSPIPTPNIPDAGLPPPDDVVPDYFGTNFFGVATSHSSSLQPQNWLPEMTDIGIRSVRGIRPSIAEETITLANTNNATYEGIFSASVFPTSEDNQGYIDNVTSLIQSVGTYVKLWEVWNEPPNFSGGANNSPEEYAYVVQLAYDTAKAIDPDAQIGFSCEASYLQYLDRALLAGAAGHYDYITIHAYDTLNRAYDRGNEAHFLGTVKTIRKMLAARDPSKIDVPILVTETGKPSNDSAGQNEAQAYSYIKIAVLCLAQGIRRMHWYEALDGDAGPFGLLGAIDTPRPAYYAAERLIEALGETPNYIGPYRFIGDHHGFVFEHENQYKMIAWSKIETSFVHEFPASVTAVNLLDGTETTNTTHTITNTSVLYENVPTVYASIAEAQKDQPYSWNGNYTNASAVACFAGEEGQGLHIIRAPSELDVVTVAGVNALDMGSHHFLEFAVDPNFLSFHVVPLLLTFQVRRKPGSTGTGFNLRYESPTSQYTPRGWNSVTATDAWENISFTLTDAQFVGRWGWNFFITSDLSTYSQYYLRSVTIERI